MSFAPRPPRPAELGCAWLFVALALLVWAGLTWIGYDLYRLTQARVPGSPYLPGQFRTFVLFPFALTVLAGALAVALRRMSKLGIVIGVIGFVLLAAVPLFLIGYSGGV